MTEEAGSIVCSDAHHDEAVLGVVAKRSYRLEAGRLGRGVPAAIVREHRYAPYEDDVVVTSESELSCLHKQTTDVLLEGTAYAHRGVVTELHTALIVGPVRKDVIVTGDRTLRVGADGAVAFSAATAFERMPLVWQRAYGGRDRGAEPPAQNTRGAPPPLEAILSHGTFAYPRNRHGRGFFIDRDRQRLDGAPLPNLSDPRDPIRVDRLLAADPFDWIDRPVPACYAPIDPITFPRCTELGLAIDVSRRSRPVAEVAMGALDEARVKTLGEAGPPTAAAHNVAPPGLATTLLLGHERVELYNLHPSGEHVVFGLPGERPRLVVEPPNAGLFELEPRLVTVLIEPDAHRVTLTWAGSTPAAGVFSPEACGAMRHAVIWS